MKPSTLIVWLLVAACIAIDLAMIGELQVRRNDWPEAGGVIGLGLAFSQIVLLSLWAVWGRNGILVRAVGVLLGVWGVSCLASYGADGRLDEVDVWFGVLLFYSGVSLVPFIIVRFANYDLSNQDVKKAHAVQSRLPLNQFTIWGLLSLMTAIGITLGVIRFADFPLRQLLEVVAFFTLLAATVCTTLLLSLFLSRVRDAIITTTLICPVAGILLSLPGLAPSEDPLELILMTCVHGGATLSAAIVLRSGGYRLVRTTVINETTASESTVAAESPSASVDQRDEL